jgi:hypothetical protein
MTDFMFARLYITTCSTYICISVSRDDTRVFASANDANETEKSSTIANMSDDKRDEVDGVMLQEKGHEQ